MVTHTEKYYKWKLLKDKKDEEEAKIFRVSAKFLELIILYVTLIFFVLSGWFKPQSDTTEIPLLTLSWLYYSLLFSVFSLIVAFSSNFMMSFSKKYKSFIIEIEETIHRISLGLFFFSIIFLFISAWFLYETKPDVYLIKLEICAYGFPVSPLVIGIFVIVCMLIYSFVIVRKLKS